MFTIPDPRTAPRTLLAATLTLALAGAACDVPPEPGEPTDSTKSTEVKTSNLGVVPNPFGTPVVRGGLSQNYAGTYAYWLMCGEREVVVGVHFANGKVMCAPVNGSIFVHSTEPSWGSSSGNPTYKAPWPNSPWETTKYSTGYNPGQYMHGCPENMFVQGIAQWTAWGTVYEDFKCVRFKDGDGYLLNVTTQTVDGYGANNNQWQTSSQPVYGVTPNMHACPQNWGMTGVHQSWNDLACAR